MYLKVRVFLCTLAIGCVTQITAQNFWTYSPVLDPKTDDNLIALKEGEDPQIVLYNNVAELSQKQQDLKDKGYVVIGSYLGHPSFKKSKNKKRAVNAAKKAGATLILAYDFTLPDFYVLQKSPLSVNKQNSNPVENTMSSLPPGDSPPRLGVLLRDLTIEERTEIERNKGAFILDVLDGSLAFDANIIPGDILIKINGLQPKNTAEAVQFIKSVGKGEDIKLTLIRKGELREITVTF
ncbi:PDZ domain-containing protein [Leptobacterium flavescens]|uniref:PDZ domain-containing protein n=1 Tax=Leptobacterium flavescens TaxID=472055 RepID=A0A6P0URS7_9FLAO|nr:PDZ domain-containing protein [Leptobacterium flavescens]NER13086.1 PDZ domain-containing protein [Leptobacterium flavescens]